MNSQFHSGAVSVALGSSLRAMQMQVGLLTVFLGVPALSKREFTARVVHHFPRENRALLHRYQPLVQFSIHNNALLSLSRGVAAMLCSDQICTVLVGRSDFDQSVTYQFVKTFRAF